MDALKKLLVLALVVFVAAPFVAPYWPKPASFERTRDALKAAGMQVEGYQETPAPGRDAAKGANLTADGIAVELYWFNSEGKIATQLEYTKKDAGTAIVESMNIAQSLGAAQPVQTPSASARNGMYMIVATGPDAQKVRQIVSVFESL